MSVIVQTQLTEDGKLTAVILDKRGKPIARLANPVRTGEEVLARAREFESNHPDLFKKGGEENELVE